MHWVKGKWGEAAGRLSLVLCFLCSLLVCPGSWVSELVHAHNIALSFLTTAGDFWKPGFWHPKLGSQTETFKVSDLCFHQRHAQTMSEWNGFWIVYQGMPEQCEVVAVEHIYSWCQFDEDALCLLKNAEVLLILGAQGSFGLVCLQVCFLG